MDTYLLLRDSVSLMFSKYANQDVYYVFSYLTHNALWFKVLGTLCIRG